MTNASRESAGEKEGPSSQGTAFFLTRGLDVLGYLSGVCMSQQGVDITEEMIAQFEADTEGASNA